MTWLVEDRSDEAPGPRTFVIEGSLGYLINRAARAFANRLATELRRFDVGIGQWAVLMHLWSNDGMTQAQLARRVAIEQPTMVRTIDRMERDGLVTRDPDPNDRRASRITLTERGWALRDDLVPLAAGVNRAATASLTAEEVTTLRELLAKLVASEAGTLRHDEDRLRVHARAVPPDRAARLGRAAEAAGFDAGFQVSEHFHPWTPQQGQAAFAWSFMGALGQRTSLPFGTAVTCPGFRYHPAVIAHAAATLGAMYPGRFWLGLGAGEALNEHVIGGEWPESAAAAAMMFESIEVIAKLFTGKVVKHDGEYFTLESARLYTRPEQPVPIYVATAGPVNAKRTGRYADGIITVGAADEKIAMLWDKFREGAAEAGKDASAMRTQLQVHVCWAPTQAEADRTPSRSGPTAACRSRSRTSATPRTSRTWRSSSASRTSRTGCSSAPTSRSTPPRFSTTSTWGSTRSTSTTWGATRRGSSRHLVRRCFRS